MISADESKKLTVDLFDLEPGDDLSFITDDFLGADAFEMAPEDLDDFPRIQYGSGMAYGWRNGKPTYEYYAGVSLPNFPTSPAQNVACGAARWWGYQELWDHDNLNSYCGGNTHNQFYRIFKLTYRG